MKLEFYTIFVILRTIYINMNQKLAAYNKQLEQLLTNEELESLKKYNLIEEICEYLSTVSRLYSHKSDKNGIDIAKIGIDLSENSDLPLEKKANNCFEYSKTVQNYLMFQESYDYAKLATFYYNTIEQYKFALNCKIFNCRNLFFLRQIKEAQNIIIDVEESIDLDKEVLSLQEIHIYLRYLQMLYYACAHTSNFTLINSNKEKTREFMIRQQPKNDWSHNMITSYTHLLSDYIVYNCMVEDFTSAKIYLSLYEISIHHPNLEKRYHEVADIDLKLLQFRYAIETNTANSSLVKNMEFLYENIDIKIGEKFNICLKFNELICKYYYKKNDVENTLKWTKSFENLKQEFVGLYEFSESSHINYYDDISNFFYENNLKDYAFELKSKIPKLHTKAMEDIIEHNLQEQKLEKKLQLEVENSIQLKAKLEAFRGRILFELKQKRILKKRFDSLIRISYTYLSQPEKLSLNEAQKEVSKVKREFEKEWSISNFENSFLELFPNFNSIFSKFAPTITKTEMKVCMALVSGLDIYAIADLLSKESKTIEEYLRRIRRKFQLPNKANLFQFLKECYSIIQK